MKLLAAALLAAFPVWAAVEGAAVNMTTGKPQPGVAITLVQPGAAGMQTLGQATSGADGTFRIDQNLPAGGPALLQSTYQGVTYTQALPPGSASSGIRVNVYDATTTPPAEMSVQHLILLEPTATELRISETFFARNNATTTYNDAANGTLRLVLPEGAPSDLRVTIDSVGVPIQRPVEKASRPGEYKIAYPIKPGETRFDMEYSIPATATFSGKVFVTDPPTRLVTPGAVTLSGDGIVEMGQEPSTQARVYTFSGDTYSVNISGVGSLRTPDLGVSPEDSGAPKCCEEVPARVHNQMGWILGLSFAILAAGGTLLFRRGAA